MIDDVALLDPLNLTQRHGPEAGAPTILLFHGLTATPNQFAAFVPRLVDAGYRVIVPRLPRHGYADRMTDALSRLRADELTAFVDTTIAEARIGASSVCVLGFSVGGLLAALVAQTHAVERAICVAPFLGSRLVPGFAHGIAPRVLGLLPNWYFWWNPLRRERHGIGDGYPRYCVSAVREAYALSQAVFAHARSAPPQTRDIAVLTHGGETTCSNSMARRLAALWRARGARVDEHELREVGVSHDFFTPLPGREALHGRVFARILEVLRAT